MATPAPAKSNVIRCHYEILAVPLDSSAAVIKKAHRTLALKYHPDKNMNDESAGETFRLVQQAYEVLSDAQERKWYDEHRDAILKGWSSGGGDDNLDILFDVTPYMVPTAYVGYADDEGGFFQVYRMVFASVFENESQTGNHDEFNIEGSHLPEDFGSSKAEWEQVATFYQSWESFTSTLNFAWADAYDVKEAPSRRVRRAMEEENRKARRSAKRSHNEDILALVRFCKRRDPRVKERKRKMEEEKELKEKQQKEEVVRKKKEALEARQQWRLESEEAMTAAEKEDRSRGRVRLADLEDDYNYGGSRKGKKGKKKNKNKLELSDDEEDEEVEEEEEEEEVPGEDEEEEIEFGRLMKNPTYYGRETPDDNLEESQDGDNKNGEELPKQAQEVGADANETKLKEDGDDNDNDKETKSEVQAQEIEADEVTQDASVGEEYDDFDHGSESESEEEEEPDYWRCECCHKDFQSEGQMENHMRSKKHKEAWKKYEKKLAKQAKDEEEMMEDLLNEVEIKD
jgi:DnaJ family protein A protein 5